MGRLPARVYARYTVRPRGALSGRSPWFHDFRALQKAPAGRPR
ncbi:hypothetical protein SMC26_29060 [Actinomadura fulvescens]